RPAARHANRSVAAKMLQQGAPVHTPVSGHGAKVTADTLAPATRWVEWFPFIQPEQHVQLLAQRLHTGLADGHLLSQTRLEVPQIVAQLLREIVGLQVLHHALHGTVWCDPAKQRGCEAEEYAQIGLRVWNFDA